jgi:mono/diheme cytochrome c family protein
MMMRCVGLGLVLCLGALLGCGRDEPPPTLNKGRPPLPENFDPATAGQPKVPPEFAGARKIFDAHCGKCHSTDPRAAAFDRGNRPPGQGMKGPNLGKLGADPSHTRQWVMNYVRDPQAQNPKARMPKFAGRISDDDLSALADYLVRLQ